MVTACQLLQLLRDLSSHRYLSAVTEALASQIQNLANSHLMSFLGPVRIMETLRKRGPEASLTHSQKSSLQGPVSLSYNELCTITLDTAPNMCSFNRQVSIVILQFLT